jgi:nucleoside-diphosphate-sugar epimerase
LGILWVCISCKPSILPSNTTPLGALPARFRRTRVLIVGCGDVGMRLLRQAGAGAGVRLLALTSSPARVDTMRQSGAVPLLGNLDHPATLARLAGLAQRVVHLAPPPGQGHTDPRTQALLQALARRTRPVQLVYASTSGVYGDCAGQWVTEERTVRPTTDRAWRRVDAEDRLRTWGRSPLGATRASVLRVPGIYAPDREGGTPRERLLRGTPVLRPQDDVYTNHIHADDLARAVWLALWRGQPQRMYQVCDDSDLKMGDYMELAADLYGLPKPQRITRAQAQAQLPPMLLSFMSESRRLDNRRMKKELRLNLHYPQVAQGLVGRRFL